MVSDPSRIRKQVFFAECKKNVPETVFIDAGYSDSSVKLNSLATKISATMNMLTRFRLIGLSNNFSFTSAFLASKFFYFAGYRH